MWLTRGSCHLSLTRVFRVRVWSMSCFRRISGMSLILDQWNGVWGLGTKEETEAVTSAVRPR